MKISPVILWIAISVLVTIQIISIFSKSPVNATAIRNEEKAKYIEANRIKDSVYYTRMLAEKDTTISSLLDQLKTNTPKLQANKIIYDKVKPSVDALPVSELIERANRFQPIPVE